MKYLFAFLFLFNSLLYSQLNEKTDSVSYYNKLSKININANNYRNALYYTQKSINYCTKNNIKEDLADQTFYLGKIYYALKKYDAAIETCTKSIALYNPLAPKLNCGYANYYLGLSYMKKDNFIAAEIFFNKSKYIFDKLKVKDSGELINLQKGILNKSNGNIELAVSIFKKIIAKPNTPEILNSKAEALYQIGIIELENDRTILASNYLNKALELNAKDENIEQKSNILLALSSVYEKMLDKSKAFSYLKQHLNLKESISILNSKRLGIDEYNKFQESERINEFALIKKQEQEKIKSSKILKLINILAIALILILSLLSLSLYKNNVIRKKTNLLLEEKNHELELAKNKAEKASKARSEFLSIVSHELRTPLNAINGITYLLLEEKPKKSQLNYLLSLKFSGDYLTTFINDILEINKIDSNKLEIEYNSFNLKELLENIQNSLKELAFNNNNNFNIEIDNSIPDYLIGDPIKLSQILLNLINNALKFTKDGTVTVLTKLNSLEDNNASIKFEVLDTGIGIPEDKLETVFENFSQGSVEINRKYGGTGLGLTIVKKLVKLLGGHIKLKSEEGKGSAFTFELPFDVDTAPLQIIAKPLPYNESVLKNKKVLLVEDNKINQMISKKMLEKKEMICEVIDNGEEAIEIAKKHTFDLILMDVHLPGINGTIATEEIRKFDTSTPIIALTAISLNENRETLLSFGMNDVITKPFIPEEFYTIITKYV